MFIGLTKRQEEAEGLKGPGDKGEEKGDKVADKGEKVADKGEKEQEDDHSGVRSPIVKCSPELKTIM